MPHHHSTPTVRGRPMTTRTYLDGPYLDPEHAWQACVGYARLIASRGLAGSYGVRVAPIPGTTPPALAVWLYANDPTSSPPEEHETP